MLQSLTGNEAIADGNFLADQKIDQRGISHNPDTAQLDHQENNALAEKGESGTGINGRQTGYTGGRGRSKKGVQPGYGLHR